MEIHTAKQINEQETFIRFIRRIGEDCRWVHISNRPEPEPDLLCINDCGERIAFELVSLTDPKVAEILAVGVKAQKTDFVTSDPSERIVKNKLSKSYTTDAHHVELIIYTDGKIITPDDAIIPAIKPLFTSIQHPFRRIWFMGESEAGLLWATFQPSPRGIHRQKAMLSPIGDFLTQ